MPVFFPLRHSKKVNKKSLCTYFKVVIEGLVERKSWGDIAVDDIKVLNGLSMTDCKGETFTVEFIFIIPPFSF